MSTGEKCLLSSPRYDKSPVGLAIKAANKKDELNSTTDGFQDKFECADGYYGAVTVAACKDGVLSVQQTCVLGG